MTNANQATEQALLQYAQQHQQILQGLEFFPNAVPGGSKSLYDYLQFIANTEHRNGFAGADFDKLPQDEMLELNRQLAALAKRLDLSSEELSQTFADLNALNTNFGHATSSDPRRDRGAPYAALRSNPKYTDIRRTGEEELFKLLIGQPDWEAIKRGAAGSAERDAVIRERIYVDGLGGNGVLAHTFRQLTRAEARPSWITSDVDPYQVANAIRRGLPAIRQFMDKPLLRESSVDGVIFAYGTHHVPQSDTLTHNFDSAMRGTHRILRPGGRVVIHDFEEGTPSAQFYSDLLANHTLTGHHLDDERTITIPHFTKDGLKKSLTSAGFKDNEITIKDQYDPFIFTGRPGQSLADTKKEFFGYLITMFGLKNLEPHAADNDLFTSDFYPALAVGGESFWDKVNKGEPLVSERNDAESNYWQEVEALISRFGQLTDAQMENVKEQRDEKGGLPKKTLTYEHLDDGRWRVTMPRVALIAEATKQKARAPNI